MNWKTVTLVYCVIQDKQIILYSFGVNEFQIILWLVLWWKPVRVMVIMSKMFFAGKYLFPFPYVSTHPYGPYIPCQSLILGIHGVRLIFISCSSIILRTW
jgi:hypothetical protein